MTENSSSRDYEQRSIDATKLIEDFSDFRDIEKYADPEKRLRFLKSVDPENFFKLAQHVNARMRSFEPSEGKNLDDEGASLPLLGTPETSEKREAFISGAQAIHEYLMTSEDSTEEKLRGTGMAAEALVIWVHPFNDGNGRTSRFLGKFIEDGFSDVGALMGETVDGRNRMRLYNEQLRVDQWNVLKGLDILWGDGEAEELEQKTGMPIAEGITKSIQHILENKPIQEAILADASKRKAKLIAARALQATQQSAA